MTNIKKLLIITFCVMFGISTACIAADLVIESKTQSYNEADNKIKFEGDVKVSIDDLKILGDKADISVNKDNKLDTATFYDKPYAYQVKNNKKREVKANILKMSLITKVVKAEGDTQSIVSDGKTPVVVITADQQEFDTKTNVMTATGGVIIKYGDLNTFSDKAVIKTDNKGDLKVIDLYGHARLKEKNNNASADHFSYNVVNEELYSEGNTMSHTELDNGKPLTIRAGYQHYTKKQNIFICTGNVQVWFDDYYARGPKLSVYPSPQTNKFNEIYFTGRSSITQAERTIYADKITMTLKPKNFYADGNTKTVIRNIKSDSFEDNK